MTNRLLTAIEPPIYCDESYEIEHLNVRRTEDIITAEFDPGNCKEI